MMVSEEQCVMMTMQFFYYIICSTIYFCFLFIFHTVPLRAVQRIKHHHNINSRPKTKETVIYTCRE